MQPNIESMSNSSLQALKNRVLNLTPRHFDQLALDIFHFQAENNPIYKQWIQLLGKNPSEIQQVDKIPFLPISFFKNHSIKSGDWTPQDTFESSGTTGMTPSRHYIEDLKFYDTLARLIFTDFYGPVENYVFLGLLPSYLERTTSSLVRMVDQFIKIGKHPESGFYLNDHEDLIRQVEKIKKSGKKAVLIGVTFGLLDLADRYEADFSDLIVMETGGMKGRRKELLREEVHHFLANRLNIKEVHSEYGMTELLSQGYSKGNSLFKTADSMKVLIRETNDPLSLETRAKSGAINIIDLGNVHSCSFIATEDLGKIHPDGSFEVLGRLDNSDIRGCNLMIS
ncbi:acyltransferase [Persicobacter diffluens]|uniref:Acyltransferase n=2 Tax=Persicobacter diffluens TaxID=981 RepID=A0AAN4VWR7_9BACT|nr:acyltransferase [Persicobacter diffluens]